MSRAHGSRFLLAKSHAITGLASWVIAAPLLHLSPLDPGSLALALCGSLLPDIDHPASWVGRRLRPVSTLVSGLFGHRGITHSAAAVAGLVLLLVHHGTSRAATASFAVGYLSHLAADMLTPRGLRLAWPLRRTWRMPLYTTGSPGEAAVVAGVCLVTACVFVDRTDPQSLPAGVRYWLELRFLAG